MKSFLLRYQSNSTLRQEEVEPKETPSKVREDFIKATFPPRDQIITSTPESSFQTPPTTQSSPASTTRFYERFIVKMTRPPRNLAIL